MHVRVAEAVLDLMDEGGRQRMSLAVDAAGLPQVRVLDGEEVRATSSRGTSWARPE
jgi:hypothetical protein